MIPASSLWSLSTRRRLHRRRSLRRRRLLVLSCRASARGAQSSRFLSFLSPQPWLERTLISSLCGRHTCQTVSLQTTALVRRTPLSWTSPNRAKPPRRSWSQTRITTCSALVRALSSHLALTPAYTCTAALHQQRLNLFQLLTCVPAAVHASRHFREDAFANGSLSCRDCGLSRVVRTTVRSSCPEPTLST